METEVKALCESCGGPVVRDRASTTMAAEKGISAAEAHANEVWKAHTLRAIHVLARSQPTLSSDDIRVWMDENYPEITTHTLSALGPMLLKASRWGWIESAGRMRSQLPVTHGKWITTWRSLI